MVYFTGIKKTEHYIEDHEKQVPFFEVIKIINRNSKNIRKKDNKFEIETNKYYVLFEIIDNTAYIINAKRK